MFHIVLFEPEIPPNIEIYADLTLREIYEKFGTLPRFKDWLGAMKDISAIQEKQLKADGSVSYKPVSAAAAWLKWPLRAEVQKITYKPGCGQLVTSPIPMFNIWPGWGWTICG